MRRPFISSLHMVDNSTGEERSDSFSLSMYYFTDTNLWETKVKFILIVMSARRKLAQVVSHECGGKSVGSGVRIGVRSYLLLVSYLRSFHPLRRKAMRSR